MGKASPQVARKAYHDYYMRNREEIREKRNEAARLASRKTDRTTLQYKCRQKLRYAVRSGKVFKPNTCSRCNKFFENKAKIHGHHHDYNKPFDVEWLCAYCHGRHHSEKMAPRVLVFKTVVELIEELSAYPAEAKIVFAKIDVDYQGERLSYRYSDRLANRIDPAKEVNEK